jgi:hypothetical protein
MTAEQHAPYEEFCEGKRKSGDDAEPDKGKEKLKKIRKNLQTNNKE